MSRALAKCIGNLVIFLMSVAELRVVPGHAVDFIVVLAIALNSIESQNPRDRLVVGFGFFAAIGEQERA